MSMSTPVRATRARPDRRPGAGLFRAVWRWHFFAAFLVVPVLLVLSVTGLIYLFRFQIEPLLHPDLMKVEPTEAAIVQPFEGQLMRVEEAYPDATVVSVTEPRAEDRSAVFSVVFPDGSNRDVFVDPYRQEVLGSLDPDRTLSGAAKILHGDLMVGRPGDALIELGACWSIVMAGTGYYLYVRGWRARRRLAAARRPGARLRARHGAIGAFVGVGLLLLLVSGLPWTGVWGEQVQRIATANGSSMWSTDPGALSDPTSTLDESLPHSHAADVPWAQGATPVPRSSGGHDPGERAVANLDTALAVAEREGLRHPMTVAMPADDSGVYSVIGYAFDAPSDERTVHVDRFDGQVVSTYGFDDYPALAKVVAHGIGLHEGRSLGAWSFWGAALMCVAVIAMCVTGPAMWWRRRPRGGSRLGAPRGRMPVGRASWLTAGLVVVGVLLPLFGLSLVVVLALDRLVLRRVPALSAYFDVS